MFTLLLHLRSLTDAAALFLFYIAQDSLSGPDYGPQGCWEQPVIMKGRKIYDSEY